MSQNVPAGFRELALASPYVRTAGPFWGRWTGEQLRLGLRVEERHLNSVGSCHGGVLALMADMLIPLAALYQLPEGHRSLMTTVSMSTDYLAPVEQGSWIEGSAQLLKEPRKLAFGQGVIEADGRVLVRFSGVFNAVPRQLEGSSDDPLRLKSAGI